MANLNKLMKKLQTALLCYDVRVKLGTRQFYSEGQGRMITVHTVHMPVWSERSNKMVDREVLSTCSTAEVVKYLADMLGVLRSETKP